MVIEIGGLKAYDADELAKILKVHPRTVRNYLKSGAIPGAKKIGNRWYITEQAIKAYLLRANGNQ